MKQKRFLTEEHKEKIRQALLGRQRPKEVIEKISNALKGKSPHNKGKKMSEEFKKKRREINIKLGIVPPSRKGAVLSEEQREKLRGRKPWNYKEDRTQVSGGLFRKDSKEYKTWSKQVKERDKYMCKLYDVQNECCGRLESHHIYNWIDYPEKRFDLNNGITLCQKHHPLGRQKEEEMILSLLSLINN